MTETKFLIEGGCSCKAVRYQLQTSPIIVHCCHCRWCQRETGASFAVNAMIESDRVISLGIDPQIINTPTESGAGQNIARCPKCMVAVWSNYSGSGPVTRFIRVGTLDNPNLLSPDVHIFTASKQPWVIIPEGVPAFSEYYDREQYWSKESLIRNHAMLPAINAYRSTLKLIDP